MANNYNSSLQNINTDLQEILNTIKDLPEADNGVELPELTNPATSSDILSGKEAIDENGNKITGEVLTVTQATPSISVSTSGLITASTTQTVGYVTAGTKSSTKQLDTQAAQTITPGTTDKTISSGKYLTGAQTIKGDSNLVSANIIKGKSIFGVNGAAEVGEDISTETDMYTDLLDELETAINNLPDAGEGGGGSAEVTGSTSLTITADLRWMPGATYQLCKVAYYQSGELVTLTDASDDGYELGLMYDLGSAPYILENVDINRPIYIEVYCDTTEPWPKSSTTPQHIFNGIPNSYRTFVFQITSADPATITFE